jgi:hypothetical protein
MRSPALAQPLDEPCQIADIVGNENCRASRLGLAGPASVGRPRNVRVSERSALESTAFEIEASGSRRACSAGRFEEVPFADSCFSGAS